MFHVKQSVMVEKALWLREILSRNGRELTSEQIELLTAYCRYLLEWNKKINLISRKDEEYIWEKHIFHSVSAFIVFDIPESVALLDIGTGGGLPGIPFKILLPESTVVLVDSIQKKIDAVTEMIEKLQLKKCITLRSRVEDVANLNGYQNKFDCTIARAVAQLSDLIKWSLPLLKNSSEEKTKGDGARIPLHPPCILTFKGGELGKEIRTANNRYKAIQIREIALEFQGGEILKENNKKIVYVQL